jgi:hypothetical protein
MRDEGLGLDLELGVGCSLVCDVLVDVGVVDVAVRAS